MFLRQAGWSKNITNNTVQNYVLLPNTRKKNEISFERSWFNSLMMFQDVDPLYVEVATIITQGRHHKLEIQLPGTMVSDMEQSGSLATYQC